MTTASRPPGVVVGVDGSAAARNAVRWAARDAAMREAPLTIVSAIPPLVGSSLVAPVPVGVLDWERESARRVLDDAVRLGKECTDGSVEVSTATPASAAVPALVELSKRADLVVVGRSGTGAMTRAMLGSVSSGVLHHAHCPVAVVHAPSEPSTVDDFAPVLVGVDGSVPSRHALEVACQEATMRGVDLVAWHAWWAFGPDDASDPEIQRTRAQVETWLEEQLCDSHRQYPGLTIRRVLHRGSSAQRMVDVPEPIQLIVVGSHGLGGFTGMLLGSVSNAVVQTASVPVIVARRR